MEITDPSAKCFYKRFLKPDVLYIFLYISGHVWPLQHVVVIKDWVVRILALFSA